MLDLDQSLITRHVSLTSEIIQRWRIQSIQYNTIQYNTTQHNTTQHNTTQHNTIQYNTIQYNTIQHNTTQHNIQYNTIQYNTIQYNIVSICVSPQMAVDSPFLYELFSAIHEVSGDVSWDHLNAARDPKKPHSTRLGNYCKLTLKMLGVTKTSNIVSTYKRFMQSHNIWKQKRNSVQKTFGFRMITLEWFTQNPEIWCVS